MPFRMVSHWNERLSSTVFEIFGSKSRARAHTHKVILLADRTNGRAYATVLRLSSSVCTNVMWLNGAC